MAIDLRREQEATLARASYTYSPLTRVFIASMDLVAGRETTTAKAKMLEVLAGIPYNAWERQEQALLGSRDRQTVEGRRRLIRWAREARDNENLHLEVLAERMRQQGEPDPWFLVQPMRFGAELFYILFANTLAAADMRQAFQFNAEFEDHAEHAYAQFAADHPEWDDEPANGPAVRRYSESTGTELTTWGDVVRRIALDERDHMNRSFVAAGKPDQVVEYEGMPEPAVDPCR